MFYIFDLINRLKYLCLSYIILLITCYFYYPVFFSFLDFLFKNILNEQNDSVLNYYIYTHPFELYYSHLFFVFIFSLHFIFPYFIWQLIDFSKTGVYSSEYKLISKNYNKCLIIIFCSYLLLYGYIIPYFLEILQISKLTYLSDFYTVFFELKVQDFINFILYLNILFTIIILFLIFLSFLIFKFSLVNVIVIKKVIYLGAIIFSTFVSPPDIGSQLLLLFLILINIEFIIFLRILKHYFLMGTV